VRATPFPLSDATHVFNAPLLSPPAEPIKVDWDTLKFDNASPKMLLDPPDTVDLLTVTSRSFPVLVFELRFV